MPGYESLSQISTGLVIDQFLGISTADITGGNWNIALESKKRGIIRRNIFPAGSRISELHIFIRDFSFQIPSRRHMIGV